MKPEKIKSWVTTILSVLATIAVMMGVDEQTIMTIKQSLGSGLDSLIAAVGLIISAIVSIIEIVKAKKQHGKY